MQQDVPSPTRRVGALQVCKVCSGMLRPPLGPRRKVTVGGRAYLMASQPPASWIPSFTLVQFGETEAHHNGLKERTRVHALPRAWLRLQN